MVKQNTKKNVGIILVAIAIFAVICVGAFCEWWFLTPFISAIATAVVALGFCGLHERDIGWGLGFILVGAVIITGATVVCHLSLLGVPAGVAGFLGIASIESCDKKPPS